jgi:hypothetical protein
MSALASDHRAADDNAGGIRTREHPTFNRVLYPPSYEIADALREHAERIILVPILGTAGPMRTLFETLAVHAACCGAGSDEARAWASAMVREIEQQVGKLKASVVQAGTA